MRPSLKQHVIVLLREFLGFKQPGFAQLVGCSLGTLQAVERGPGRLKLSAEMADKIFIQTGISPEWLMANDFDRPMVAWVGNEPYTKEVFEIIQARKRLPPDYAKELQDTQALKACGKLFAALNSAQIRSMEASFVAGHRIYEFTTKLAREFGINPDDYEGEEGWMRGINLVERKVAEFRRRDAPLPYPKPARKQRDKRARK